jgi:hypothetical protein
MTEWQSWLLLLVGLAVLFVMWSWVPLERLDRYWSLNNPVGRPLLHTVVLTGLPALYAKQVGLSWAWLLIPLTFFLTQYAVLSGRFLQRQFNTAGWVMLVTTVAIWSWFFLI